MVLLITGATGGLGRKILQTLQTLDLPAGSFAGSTSSLARLPADLKASGIPFREANFNDPASLDEAFKGVTRLLITSTDTFDNAARIQQHKNAVDAAKRAGIGRVYYTSLVFGGYSDDSKMGVMGAHLVTEQYIKELGLEYTIIREGAYADAFPFFLNWFPDTTKITLTADGEVAWTSRDELGEATAKLLADTGKFFEKYRNSTVLLTAQEKLDLRGVTKLLSETLGKKIDFEIVPFEQYKEALVAGGKPEWLAPVWGSTYDGLAKGEGGTIDPLMEELLGRKPIGATEWIRKALTENPRYTWHQQGNGQQ